MPETKDAILDRFDRDVDKIAEHLATVLNERRGERQTQRDEVSGLQAQIAELSKKVPSDSASVLTPEQAQLWKRYQELGTPDELTTIKTERDDFHTKYRHASRTAAIQQAAQTEGLNAAKLEKLLPRLISEDAAIEIREVDQQGQKVKQAFVTQGETATRLIDVPEVAEVIDALRTESQGVRYPQQSGGTGEPVKNMTQRFIEQRDQAAQAKANPLAPAKGT